MVELKEIDLDKNSVKFADHTEVSFGQFYDTFVGFWNNRIAGETISPFDMERFMKRGSSKNLKQFIDGKKSEGYMEAMLGKKVDAGFMRWVLIIVVCAIIGVVAWFIMTKMGLL